MLLSGVPIAVAIGLAAVCVMLATGGPDLLQMLIQRMWSGATSFPLLAVPFFTLAGNLMNTGGVTRRIFDVANVLVGRIHGGLAHVVVLASMLFAGMTGSAVAEAAGLATVSIKAMEESGFSRRFAAALIAAASTIGPIIPPSIPFVIYGSLAGVSVGRLFLAGFAPGILMGLALMIAVWFMARRLKLRKTAQPRLAESLVTIVGALPALGTPVIIVGGILTGFFTPTEASAVAAVYALVLGLFVDRDLKFSDLPEIFWLTAKQTAQILIIIAVASAFGWVTVQQQIPNQIIAAVLNLTHNPWIILLIANVVLLIMGFFLEPIAIMIITLPIFLPLVAAVGIDPVHFGVVMVLNLMLGLIHPPVGVCLFAVSAVTGMKIGELTRGILPFFGALIVVLLIVTYAPDLILWLPNMAMGK
jgi:tripartite ATP-independent transporter DctM subunit